MFSRYKDVLTHLPEYSKNIFRRGYFKWLIDQCRGWGWFSYGLLIFNFILQVWSMVQSFSATREPRSLRLLGATCQLHVLSEFQTVQEFKAGPD